MLTGSTSLFLFLAAFIGLLVGLLIASIFFGRESRGSKKSAVPKDVEKEGFAESATLWYSPAGKKIITELDGEFYRDTSTLSTDQKTRVMQLLSLWQGWADKEKLVIPSAEPQAEPFMEAQAEETQPAAGPVPSEQAYVPVKPFKLEPEEFDAVSELQETYGDSLQEEPATEPIETKSLSITEQISEILEGMLEGTPLKEKGIKLIENQQNGVDVWIGLNKYPGIDAVPDPAVRDMIRNAVLRWEEENDARRKLQGQ
jgi:hypothetical protein